MARARRLHQAEHEHASAGLQMDQIGAGIVPATAHSTRAADREARRRRRWRWVLRPAAGDQPVPLSVLTDSTKPRMSTPPWEAAISISPAEHRALAVILEPFWVTMALGDTELDLMVMLPAAAAGTRSAQLVHGDQRARLPAPARSTAPPAVMVIVGATAVAGHGIAGDPAAHVDGEPARDVERERAPGTGLQRSAGTEDVKRSVHLERAAGPEIVERRDLAFADGVTTSQTSGEADRWPRRRTGRENQPR